MSSDSEFIDISACNLDLAFDNVKLKNSVNN